MLPIDGAKIAGKRGGPFVISLPDLQVTEENERLSGVR